MAFPLRSIYTLPLVGLARSTVYTILVLSDVVVSTPTSATSYAYSGISISVSVFLAGNTCSFTTLVTFMARPTTPV